MRFDIVTLFPGLFAGPLDFGVLRRARETGLVEVALHDLRQWTTDRHRTVDDRPYGGGEGMVLKPEPLAAAIESLGLAPRDARDSSRESVVLLSAQGRSYNQQTARELSRLRRVVLLCGRYEGVDERIHQLFCDRELSIGDYILSGGELAAAILVDSVTRLVPGVLGNPDSAHHESFGAAEVSSSHQPGQVPRSTHATGGLLDYPHYTRPPEFRGLAVPGVLCNGDHESVRRWRRRMSLSKTLQNRPDLLQSAPLSAEDRAILADLRASLDDTARDDRT